VPKCSDSDAACGTGLICVDNGCVPPATPTFTCDTDGKAGDGKKGDCDTGSTCLHHSCYISCDPEASTCVTAANFNVCKSVMEGTGTYYVCGSTTSLGSECDPTKACTMSGQVCIDGFCR